MKQRIPGFDLARAYAIFGMFIVNFNLVFGRHNDPSFAGQLLSLFSGNSSTVFVMLAGMGLSIMSGRVQGNDIQERKRLRNLVLRRAVFLTVLGLLLSTWWPADILHCYGAYMLAAAFLLFIPRRYYLWIAALAVAVFHLLLLVVPYETGWDFNTLTYLDFQSLKGFARSLLYNGWNPVFPWFAYFSLGLYLGRLNWTLVATRRRVFCIGLCLFVPVEVLQLVAGKLSLSAEMLLFIRADYLPPFLPFILGTMGFGLMLIAALVILCDRIPGSRLLHALSSTGRMTLTHYIVHLTIGMLALSALAGGLNLDESGTGRLGPLFILLFSAAYFVLSAYFSKLWNRKFRNGPFELLMRRLAG